MSRHTPKGRTGRPGKLYIWYKGENRALTDVCEELGLSRMTTYMRLRDGWTVEEALTLSHRTFIHVHRRSLLPPPPKPPRKIRRDASLITHGGRAQTVSQWCEELDLEPRTVYRRLKRGLPVEQILSTKPLYRTPK